MYGQTHSLFGFDAEGNYQRRPRDTRRSIFSSNSNAFSYFIGYYTDYRGWQDMSGMVMDETLTTIVYSKEKHTTMTKKKHIWRTDHVMLG